MIFIRINVNALPLVAIKIHPPSSRRRTGITSIWQLGRAWCAAQLSSDLGYLSNIVRALNVEYEELDRWKEYVGMNDEEGRRVIGGKSHGDQVLVLAAKMRGWM
ncbi:hypothetical protein K503DRAFT_582785 [Rhizopogon vinicolor AM-OR11-026]|uniref:Uncharacterized protein n=1 Tax=Rhizopogon vinicolor AM-OR11-026 TaxID=1314800 RepID=A0A1B7N7B6_9AGAM|nr:hypothetical protein K503DRAFT_582785 [Rhizopogon vinicolor AM-OR11-026]